MNIKDIGIGLGLGYAYSNWLTIPNDKRINVLLENWAFRIKAGTAQEITNLYAKKAVLLGTYSKHIRIGHEQILDYFVGLKQKSGLGCEILSNHVQVEPSLAIASGEYRFFWDGGEAKARFSFVFRDKGLSQWEIINHHSSVIPD
jgi:hypothetical protein